MIFTLGYEGLDVDTFIAHLRREKVSIVVDVREMPISRKKGFSKKSFAEKLSSAGFVYVHRSRLGCPKDIRDDYRVSGNWADYASRFSRYLATQSEAVREIADIAMSKRICLVCYEADNTRCHRTAVSAAADRIAGVGVRHLRAKKGCLGSQLLAAA